MERILVNTEQLRTMASRLYQIENSLQGIEQAMESLTSTSETIWQGEAREEAETDFKEVREKSSVLREQLQKRAKSLEEVAASYDKTEGNSQRIVGSLAVDNIFG